MRSSFHRAGISVLGFALWYQAVLAVPSHQTQLPENPNELVRETVQNELNPPSRNEVYFTWKQRTVKPNRTIVRQMVETPAGLIARVISINDRQLTPEELRKEDQRIYRLLDPSQMNAKRKEQKDDEERTRKMVAALPDAFQYEYAGTEQKDGHTWVNLKFKPNPHFDPPSRETLVFEGMQGDMTIDSTAKRIAKIDGTMMKDVSIGWGIIGRLDKGGRFYVEQAPIGDGQWEITKMRLNFNGRALIFKSIHIDSVDTATDFKKVPKMSVQEALDMLKKADSTELQDGSTLTRERR
jgi:hypothetical protein